MTLLQFIPCGLVFDGIGVILLGLAFFSPTFTAIDPSWDIYAASATHATQQKSDGIAGTVLLCLGFLLQLLGYLQISLFEGYQARAVSVLYFLLGGFLFVYFAWIRKHVVGGWMNRTDKTREK